MNMELSAVTIEIIALLIELAGWFLVIIELINKTDDVERWIDHRRLSFTKTLSEMQALFIFVSVVSIGAWIYLGIMRMFYGEVDISDRLAYLLIAIFASLPALAVSMAISWVAVTLDKHPNGTIGGIGLILTVLGTILQHIPSHFFGYSIIASAILIILLFIVRRVNSAGGRRTRKPTDFS